MLATPHALEFHGTDTRLCIFEVRDCFNEVFRLFLGKLEEHFTVVEQVAHSD
jgi:hypothetical protein